MVGMNLRKDANGKLFLTITEAKGIRSSELELCDYIMFAGVRFDKKSSADLEHDARYEEGGIYYHLRNERDH